MDCSDKRAAQVNPEGRTLLVSYDGQYIGGNSWLTTPFVTKEDEYVQAGERWIIKEIWTLNGKILDCESYGALLEKETILRDYFASDYKNLVVGSGLNEMETLYYAQVVSIDFPSSQYLATP